MVKEILHGNINFYYYVDSIAKMLAVRSDNGSTNIRNKKYFSHFF